VPDSDRDFTWPPDELVLGPAQPAAEGPAEQAPPPGATPNPQPPFPLAPRQTPEHAPPVPMAANGGGDNHAPSPWAEPPHRTEPHPPTPPAATGPIHRPAPAPHPRPAQADPPSPGPHPSGPLPPGPAAAAGPTMAVPPVTAAPGADPAVPTADEFARRRVVRPPQPIARTGVRGAVSKGSLGLVKIAPGGHEREINQQVDTVRRNFGGLRQVTVVNPKGGAGKTVAVLLLAMTFGQKRGGYVLAWDNNETQGTLGMRAQQDFHSRTVRDLLRDLDHFSGPHGRVGDLSQYVRAQGEGMFDVLASDESATAGEMLTSGAFADIREVVSRFYKLIMVDTGNNVRAANWQAAIDATDQLVVTMSARNDSAETAARMLDHLEQTGRQRLVRQAVTVVSMPPSRRDIDLPPIQRHFAARTRAVLLAPYERLIDTGEPLRYGLLSTGTREAWLRVASAVAEGL
jgi:MinD-like ATPase involved in chromosome partitioning or flagellar assembly